MSPSSAMMDSRSSVWLPATPAMCDRAFTAVAGEVKVTAGAGAALRSMIGRPRDVDDPPALLKTPDIDRVVDTDVELWEDRRPV